MVHLGAAREFAPTGKAVLRLANARQLWPGGCSKLSPPLQLRATQVPPLIVRSQNGAKGSVHWASLVQDCSGRGTAAQVATGSACVEQRALHSACNSCTASNRCQPANTQQPAHNSAMLLWQARRATARSAASHRCGCCELSGGRGPWPGANRIHRAGAGKGRGHHHAGHNVHLEAAIDKASRLPSHCKAAQAHRT